MSRRDFSDETINQAWIRSGGGYCECTRSSHNHGSRCSKPLIASNRGRDGLCAWEANHKSGDASDNSLSNCELLCWDCHKNTRNFGRS